MKSIIIFIIAYLAVVFNPVRSRTINIPDDYPTIQQGIDAAVDGDWVVVQPGIYTENINFNGKGIVVTSLFSFYRDIDNITSTIIDANFSGSVVNITGGESGTATITGFTLRNGRGNQGGGISCQNSQANISFNIIASDSAYSLGGAICCLDSRVWIHNNFMTENSCGESGAAIYLDHCEYTYIRLNRIEYNSCSNTGIIIANECSGEIYIANNLIVNNEILGAGGAIGLSGCDSVLIRHNTIACNNCWGLVCGESQSVKIDDSIFWGNADGGIDGSEELILALYCDIQSGSHFHGENNIEIDPLFRNEVAGDFRLQSLVNPDCGGPTDSPCIDAGGIIDDSILGCDLGLGQRISDMGVYGGSTCPCGDYIVGDYTGNGVFNLADVVASYGKLKGLPFNPGLLCECPPGSGNVWAVAMDVNRTCAFNIADVYIAFSKLKTGLPILMPTCDCPPRPYWPL